METTKQILDKLNNLDEEFQSYLLFAFTALIAIIFLLYLLYLNRLNSKECDYMNDLYPAVN